MGAPLSFWRASTVPRRTRRIDACASRAGTLATGRHVARISFMDMTQEPARRNHCPLADGILLPACL